MTYERFLKVILSLQKEERTINVLYTETEHNDAKYFGYKK